MKRRDDFPQLVADPRWTPDMLRQLLAIRLLPETKRCPKVERGS